MMARGQPAHDTLQASIARGARGVDDLPRLEAALLCDFRAQAGPYLEAYEHGESRTVIGSMILLQHHGGASSLLDWTDSIWVAAYFSCNKRLDKPGYIWCYQVPNWEMLKFQPPQQLIDTILEETSIGTWSREVRRGWEDDVNSYLADRWLLPFRPSFLTRRMAAQQAMFTLANPVHVDHGEVIASLSPPEGRICIEVAPSLKPPLRRLLNTMNIHASTLFPGLDGVCIKLGEDAAAGLR